MDTQFGVLHIWHHGDWVARSVFVVLLAMSVASWMVILVKALDLHRLNRAAQAALGFWQAKDYADGLDRLEPHADNPFHQLAVEGREAAAHLQHRDPQRPHLHDSLDLSDWLTRCLRAQLDTTTHRLQAGLTLLASVGSTAPFIGLFATVWGIYHALLTIGAAGQATLDKVAGPIGEALIMTALGLAVAIPAVLGYNALVRGNKALLAQLNRFAHDLHAYFLTGARVGESGGQVVPMKKSH